MKEYKVLLGLRSGKEYSFIVNSETKEEIISEIRNQAAEEWYSFVSDYINYMVERREIISIGIEMNEEEIFDHVRRLNPSIQPY